MLKNNLNQIYAYLLLAPAIILMGTFTNIPSIKTRKVFPGCVKSLDGYPLQDSSDYSTVEYISCIASQISSSQSPWDTIKRLGKASISKYIKANIEKFVLSNDDIRRKMRTKMEWLLLNPGNDIPMDLDISRWKTFMPPLVPIEQKTIENISESFKDDFMRNLKTANPKQREQIGIIKGKIQSFSISFLKKVPLDESGWESV